MVACIDQGPVQVIFTGSSLPLKFSSDSTNTSLLVWVRPLQRPFTYPQTGPQRFDPGSGRLFQLIYLPAAAPAL
jgi:hypothetical protein